MLTVAMLYIEKDIFSGKPTLDDLGFVSDRATIELRSLGLRFCTVLPDE